MSPATEGGFRRLLGAQAAHAAGDALVAIALAGSLFFGLPVGQARTHIALYLVLTMAPFAVLSPFVGPLLDRSRGAWRTAMIASSAGRALLALLMASRTRTLSLYPLAFAMLVLSRTHGVSRAGAVPELVPEDKSLLWANARLAIASVAGGLVIGVPAAGIQKLAGSDWTLRIAFVAFGFATVLCARLPRPEATGDQQRRRVVKGAHRLLAPRLLAGGALAATSRAALGFLTFFLAFALRRAGHSAAVFGLALSAAGIGTLVGSAVAPWLRRHARESVMVLGSVFVLGAFAFALSSSFGASTAVVMALVAGVCTNVARLGFDSLVQRDAPEEVRGRTFARYETIFQLCWVAAAAVGTVIPFGPRAGMRMIAVICLVGAIVAVRGALRSPPPEADPPALPHS